MCSKGRKKKNSRELVHSCFLVFGFIRNSALFKYYKEGLLVSGGFKEET